MAAGLMIAAGLSAQLMPRVGHKAVILGGIALLTAGVVWMALLKPTSGYVGGLVGPEILFGMAPGAAFTAYNDVILSGVEGEDSGAASSLLEAMQWVGGTVGMAVLVTVYGTAGRHDARHLPAGLSAEGAAHHVLTHGLNVAFATSLVFVVLATLVTATRLKGVRAQ